VIDARSHCRLPRKRPVFSVWKTGHAHCRAAVPVTGLMTSSSLTSLRTHPLLAGVSENVVQLAPTRPAGISVSMTAGSLSLDGTAIADLPFSKSTGRLPNLIVMNR
jgi:hypothetical protein